MAPRLKSFRDKLDLLDRLGWLLVFVPVLTDYAERGHFSRSPRAWLTEFTVGLLIVGFLLVLRKTHQEIRKLEELRRTLTDSIIHDLRNPMTAVVGTLSSLEDGDLDADTRVPLVNMALRACHYQTELIEDLLDVDRLEEARFPVERRPVSAWQLLDSCREKVRLDAELAGVSLGLECPDGLAPLQLDPELLGRVLLNLVWNALKYTPRAGTITLRCVAEPEAVRFEVADTGRGVPPEHVPKVFEKYYRVEGRDAARRGVGLGLYFCRLAVEAHGGSIDLSSAPGRGTTVSVRLPR